MFLFQLAERFWMWCGIIFPFAKTCQLFATQLANLHVTWTLQHHLFPKHQIMGKACTLVNGHILLLWRNQSHFNLCMHINLITYLSDTKSIYMQLSEKHIWCPLFCFLFSFCLYIILNKMWVKVHKMWHKDFYALCMSGHIGSILNW